MGNQEFDYSIDEWLRDFGVLMEASTQSDELAKRTLTEISWLRGGRKRKWLVCKPTMQKVSTTFSTLSRYFLKLPMPLGHVSSAGVGAATPRAVSPTPAAVRARAGCSARALIAARRPAADAHQA